MLRKKPSNKKFVPWGVIGPSSTEQFNISHQILLLNTLEINYLYYLIEINPKISPLGHVLAVNFDQLSILGVGKVEVPLDITLFFNLTLL